MPATCWPPSPGLATSGIMAASFYIAAYAAMNVGIFAVVTLVSGYDEKLPLIDDFRGLIYRSPLLGSLLIFFLVSLVGIPFTGGFFGKFYLLLDRGGRRSNLAGHHRPAEFRPGRRVLSAPGSGRGADIRTDAKKASAPAAAGGHCGGRGPAAGGCGHAGSGNCSQRRAARGRSRRSYAASASGGEQRCQTIVVEPSDAALKLLPQIGLQRGIGGDRPAS